MENIYLLIGFYIALELFELQWQKGANLIEMLSKMYRYYSKNVLLFLLMHPTYYFGIGLVMITDFSLSAVALLLIKTVDIATKIILIQQIFDKKSLPSEMASMLVAPLHPLMPYLGLFVYTPLVYLAFRF